MANPQEEVATPTGLEPVISAVTGRRVNHYTKGPDARDENPRWVPERFTSLIQNPESKRDEGIQTTVHSPKVSVPSGEHTATKSSHVIVEAIFEDGSSFAHTYRYARDENEALQATWQEARLTGKPVRTVHVMAVRRG